MKRINAPCGNDCSICPKKNATDSAEIKRLSDLWHKLGFSDRPLSVKEMQCGGCLVGNKCRYGVSECADKHNTASCATCTDFPCEKVGNMLLKTKEFDLKARELCNEEDYEVLSRAFFRKGKNLLKIKSK